MHKSTKTKVSIFQESPVVTTSLCHLHACTFGLTHNHPAGLPNTANLLQTGTSSSQMSTAEVSLNEFSLIQSINTLLVGHDDKAPTKLTVSLPPGKVRPV